MPGPGQNPLPGAGMDIVFDFEDGATALSNWTVSGSAFANQPTYGDNVRVSRARRTAETIVDGPEQAQIRNTLLALSEGLAVVGGDYWDTAFPIGHQGDYWIGTFENRPLRSMPWAQTQGDIATGIAVSPTFRIDHLTFSLLIGGGCDPATTHVRLEVESASGFIQAMTTDGSPILFTGRCTDVMRRVSVSVEHLRHQNVRVVILDSNGLFPWGHINVDNIGFHVFLPPADQPRAVWGFVDTHSHLASEESFQSFLSPGRQNAQLFWGRIGGSIEDYDVSSGLHDARMSDDLDSCNDTHVVNSSPFKVVRDITVARLEGQGREGAYHSTDGGFPTFTDWPLWHSTIHQQSHVTWLHRAYQGGLRLMVADVTNSEALGWVMSTGAVKPFSSDGGAITRQVDRIKRFAQSNASWMEIAYTPAGARRIIQEGKLAVILGLEVDDLLDGCTSSSPPPTERIATVCSCPSTAPCATVQGWASTYGDGGISLSNPDVYHQDPATKPTCSAANLRSHLDRLVALGIRHIIPVHLTDNDIGAAAIYNQLFTAAQVFGDRMCAPFDYGVAGSDITFSMNDQALPVRKPLGPQPYYTGMPLPVRNVPVTNRQGLTALGRLFFDEAMKRGLLLDIDHASEVMVDQILQTGQFDDPSSLPDSRSVIAHPTCPDLRNSACWELAYPLMTSHAGSRFLTFNEGTERSLRNDQLVRLSRIGGFFGVGLNPGSPNRLVHAGNNVDATCDGSSRSWAQTYQFILNTWKVVNPDIEFPGLGLGSDFNGLDFRANPRFGRDACYLPYARSHDDGRSSNEISELRARHSTQVALQTKRVAYYTPTVSVHPRRPATRPAHIRDFGAPMLAHTETEAGRVTRSWDINYDGLAHAGLLPDFLQDTTVVGLRDEQMNPLFLGAEHLIRMWERACSLSSSTLGVASCRP